MFSSFYHIKSRFGWYKLYSSIRVERRPFSALNLRVKICGSKDNMLYRIQNENLPLWVLMGSWKGEVMEVVMEN